MKKLIIPCIIMFVAMAVLNALTAGGDARAYTTYSRGELGTSLLFDTLAHMGYPVTTGRRPLTSQTDTDTVYILIQPFVSRETTVEWIDWVSQGGRLILLHNQQALHWFLAGHNYRRVVGDLVVYYQIGSGELVLERASPVINRNLMVDPSGGERIQSSLDRWNADRIVFAEYYHGFRASETFLGGLPLILRLGLAQIGLAGAAVIFYLGRRFGRAIPYYEETEREENEYVRALARLYMATDRRGKGKIKC